MQTSGIKKLGGNMHPNSESERFYNEMSARISALPAEKRPDAIFTLFGIGLKLMERDAIVELRAELAERFPEADDVRNMNTVLIEMIDGHLALRDIHESPGACCGPDTGSPW